MTSLWKKIASDVAGDDLAVFFEGLVGEHLRLDGEGAVGSCFFPRRQIPTSPKNRIWRTIRDFEALWQTTGRSRRKALREATSSCEERIDS